MSARMTSGYEEFSTGYITRIKLCHFGQLKNSNWYLYKLQAYYIIRFGFSGYFHVQLIQSNFLNILIVDIKRRFDFI